MYNWYWRKHVFTFSLINTVSEESWVSTFIQDRSDNIFFKQLRLDLLFTIFIKFIIVLGRSIVLYFNCTFLVREYISLLLFHPLYYFLCWKYYRCFYYCVYPYLNCFLKVLDILLLINSEHFLSCLLDLLTFLQRIRTNPTEL